MNILEKKREHYERKITDICFDEQSIHKIKPGLKMIYASEASPVFVRVNQLNQVEPKQKTSAISRIYSA